MGVQHISGGAVDEFGGVETIPEDEDGCCVYSIGGDRG